MVTWDQYEISTGQRSCRSSIVVVCYINLAVVVIKKLTFNEGTTSRVHEIQSTLRARTLYDVGISLKIDLTFVE